MKRIKRKNKKKPLKVELTSGRKIIVPKQKNFDTRYLRRRGCPFVVMYEALQFCGVKNVGIKKLWRYGDNHLHKYMKGALTSKGVEAELKHFLDGIANVKRYAPNDISDAQVRKFLDAGCFVITNRFKVNVYPKHYYGLISDNHKTYRLNNGKCTKTKVKKEMAVKNKSKRYGGIIVVTPLDIKGVAA